MELHLPKQASEVPRKHHHSSGQSDAVYDCLIPREPIAVHRSPAHVIPRSLKIWWRKVYLSHVESYQPGLSHVAVKSFINRKKLRSLSRVQASVSGRGGCPAGTVGLGATGGTTGTVGLGAAGGTTATENDSLRVTTALTRELLSLSRRFFAAVNSCIEVTVR